MQRNTAFKAAFQLYNAASGAMATGIGNTCTIAFNLDGTNQSTGSITEIANGDYYVSATAANANGATGFITGSSNVSGVLLSGTRYDFGDAINQYSLSVTNGQVIGTGTSTFTAGGQVDLINAPNATAITAIQSGLSKPGTAQTITPADTTAAQTAQTQIGNVSTGATTIKSMMVGIISTVLTESTTGWLVAAFKKFFNVSTPTATADTMGTLANQTSILNAVNGITTNTARSAPRVPDFLARPASGSVAYTGDLYLYNLQGQLEDADSNAITVHARNAAGTSLDTGLTSTTMTRISIGFYRMTYTVNSTDTAQAVYFDFSWAIASVAMKDGAATEVQDAENYSALAAIQAKTNLIATNSADSPNAVTAQTTIATINTNVSALPTASTIATAVWAATTRTLSAISDSSGITTLLSRIGSALAISAGKVAATVATGDGADSATNKTLLGNISTGVTTVRSNGVLVLDALNGTGTLSHLPQPLSPVLVTFFHNGTTLATASGQIPDDGTALTLTGTGYSLTISSAGVVTVTTLPATTTFFTVNYSYQFVDPTGGGGGGLSGPSQLTIHYQDSTGTLVPSVELTISGSAYRANTSGGVATGITDGSYTIVSGMTNLILFPVTTITVSGNTSVTITGATATIPFTPAPGTVVGSMIATDGSGNLQEGIVFNFALIADPNGDLISGSTTTFSATSDSSGNAYAEFVPGWKYTGQRANGIVAKKNGITFIAPASNWQLPTMLGQ